MIPDEVPIFTKDDLLPPGSNEYEEGERATTEGWLKKLFLYGNDEVSVADRKDYELAVNTFKRENGIAHRTDLIDWEDDIKNTQAKQARALNKCMKGLGYYA